MKLAIAIAPQHSRQYAEMAGRLAAPELRASPAGAHVLAIEAAELGGRSYLLASIAEGIAAAELMPALSRLAATAGVFECHEGLPGLEGPLLRPLAPVFDPLLPLEMAEARRYKGKTSELFARVLLNLALFAGSFRERSGERLRVLDPLAGGGTTLFLALAAGHDAFGVELDRRNVETTAVFVRSFCASERIACSELNERRRRRYRFELGPRGNRRLLVLAEGDTRNADVLLAEAPGGARFHAVSADLPYGIQHAGAAQALVAEAAAAWERTLLPGGALALAWDATRLGRDSLAATLRDHSPLRVRDDGPYGELGHRVDRVIKRRDVLVAVKPP
jgi:SAM-dependent methyltransferase